MKRRYLNLFAVTLLFAGLSLLPLNVQAQESQIVPITFTQDTSTIQPRADIIEYRYRTLADGTLQRRRWNATKQVWVDPDWITVG